MDTQVGIDRDTIIRGLKALEPVLRARGVTSLAIFGSRARGDARPDSDLDLLIEVDETRKFSLIDLIGVERIVRENMATDFETNAIVEADIEPALKNRIEKDLIEVFR